MLPVWLTDTITPDLDRALHYTLLWGLDGVVLRAVGGRGDRVPYVNEEKLRRRLGETELAAAAVDPGVLEGPPEERAPRLNELATLDETAAFCRRIGCRRVLTGGLPSASGVDAAADLLRRGGDVAARHGCTLAVRNDADGRATAASVAEVLAAADHPAVRAGWSPADALEAGETAEDGLTALGTRVDVVFVRDGVTGPQGWQPRPLGEGAVGWEDVLRRLHQQGFEGALCLDLRDVGPKEGLREATALIHLIRQVRRG